MAFLTRYKLSATFRDGYNNSATATHYTTVTDPDDAAIATYFEKLALISVAAMEHKKFGIMYDDPAVNAGGGDYPDVEDKAILEFQATDGSILRHTVPAPADEMFLSDRETVDKLATIAADAITAILAVITTAAGRALIEYVKGYRVRGKARPKAVGVFYNPPDPA